MKRKLLYVFLCLCLVLTLGGCGKKNVITTERFKEVVGKYELMTIDVTTQYSSYNYIKEATSAKSEKYGIDFYVLDTEENAKSMYNTNKTLFESYKGSTSSDAEVNLSNYSTYSLLSNGKYYYIARVENTLLYISINKENMDTVKKIVKELGY